MNDTQKYAEPSKAERKRRADPRVAQFGKLAWAGLGRATSSPEHTPVLILCLCTIATLIAWIGGMSDDRLRIPLLLAGLAIIASAVLIRNSAFVATLAILVVGILVAPRDYLLRIAHMVARPEQPFEQYAKRYEGEEASGTEPVVDFTSRVIAELERRGLEITDQLRKDLGHAVSDSASLVIADKVRSAGADFPLGHIVRGRDSAIELARDFAGQPFFEEDMRFLRTEGLITFSGTDYAAAEPTALGLQVERVISSGPLAADSSGGNNIALRPPPQPPAVNEATQVSVGELREGFPLGDAPTWVRFVVDATGSYRIRAVGENGGDPECYLFRVGQDQSIAYNDDSDQSLNSKIELDLEPGEYMLAVRQAFMWGSIHTVSIEVAQQ